MALIRPRLTDYHGIHLAQVDLDFAIPFFEEDIPLYVDPFLLWKSPSYQDHSLHQSLLNSFNYIGDLAKGGKIDSAIRQLVIASECNEVSLGVSARGRGARIGKKTAEQVASLFQRVTRYRDHGIAHIEELQLLVDGIGKDRVSDFACSLMKDFLIDFTIDECEQLGIPMSDCKLENLYDLHTRDFKESVTVKLPINPKTGKPILLVPRRWLRYNPWIDYDDYFKSYCPRDDIINPGEPIVRVKVLHYNRDNYGAVEHYIKEKERTSDDCRNDPLFKQIPVLSAARKLSTLQKLPTGNVNKADKIYEEAVGELLATLMYPQLDFADLQSRTSSGTHIRDVIFYNNRSHPFLKELSDEYGCRQVVMELKNVAEIEREHINQLNRYMTDELGKFGVLVTRNQLPKARRQDTIDLWSGQRRCIVALTDSDLAQMVEVFRSKQRQPLDVLKKKYVEFRRACPG